MRKIKFRAWDKKNNVMLDDVSTGTIMVFGKTNHRCAESIYCIFQQFTGLLDKNGREIYEGDIVETNGIDGKLKWVFVYTDEDSGVFSGFIPEGLGHDYSSAHNDINDCEIIGNIFEDLDLLQS